MLIFCGLFAASVLAEQSAASFLPDFAAEVHVAVISTVSPVALIDNTNRASRKINAANAARHNRKSMTVQPSMRRAMTIPFIEDSKI